MEPDPSEKAALRARLRAERDRIPEEARRAAARRVEDALFALPRVHAASSLALFSSFGSEIPTEGMAARVLDEGKRLLLPFLTGDGMEMAAVADLAELEPTSYGPREPRTSRAVDPAVIDVIVVPGLAFDRSGNRLGYGGGSYDRYLARLPPDTIRIGIGFDVQVVERLPADEADERVDIVVTERGSFECRPVQ